MALADYHPDYIKSVDRWVVCRDVLDGEDTVKSKTNVYLPCPNGMELSDYYAYKTRAAFVGFVARARDAMCGLVGRRKPVLSAPEEIKEMAKDITTTGLSLDAFAFSALREMLATGRGGILVEYPEMPEGALSVADVENLGARPYLAMYTAEDILDWREGMVKGKKVLTYLKLREYSSEPSEGDPYTVSYVQRLRVLRLDEEGFCVFELWETKNAAVGSTDSTTWNLISAQDEKRVYSQGAPIPYIPFVFFGPFGLSSAIQRPPLLDMAWLNVHHYRASADRNHAVHWADVPTPVIIGQMLTKDGAKAESVNLGPTSAINLQAGGDAKFLEMLGNGIQPTKELMQEYVEQMSTLGNKILATDTKAAEAAETAAIHRSGEQAILATMANVLSEAVTRALYMMAERAGIDGYIDYRLSTDYLPNPMDSQTLIALIKAVIAAKISDREFFDALVAGEIVRPDKTFEDHVKEITAMPKPPVEVASKELASEGLSPTKVAADGDASVSDTP